jgi:hypothetical protein
MRCVRSTKVTIGKKCLQDFFLSDSPPPGHSRPRRLRLLIEKLNFRGRCNFLYTTIILIQDEVATEETTVLCCVFSCCVYSLDRPGRQTNSRVGALTIRSLSSMQAWALDHGSEDGRRGSYSSGVMINSADKERGDRRQSCGRRHSAGSCRFATGGWRSGGYNDPLESQGSLTSVKITRCCS